MRAPLSDIESAELDGWLDADPRHRGAYVRAQAAWQALDRSRALANGLGDGPEPVVAGAPDQDSDHDQGEHRYSRRRWIGAAAAGIVVAVGGWGAAGLFDRAVVPVRYATVGEEVREIVLEDGSRAVLNADSAIEVAFTDARRSLRLLRGEAWFAVEHDRARPFVVASGSAQAEAVGTAFSVRRDAAGTAIAVTEGVVRVSSDREPPALVRKRERAIFDAAGAGLVIRAEEDTDRALAWRFGQLAFDGETLGEAAAQFNRYNRRKLSIGDHRLAAERVSGLFDMREPDRFARAAATMFDARVVPAPGDAIVLRRR